MDMKMSEAALQGYWRRRWISRSGEKDFGMYVYWMQVGNHYVDIRIPTDQPDLAGASKLSDLDGTTLLLLLRAQGFAGHIVLEGNICTWHRAINWHGQTVVPDRGLLSFTEGGLLMEDAPDGSYRECWEHRVPAETQISGFTADGQTGYIVSDRHTFLFGIGKLAAISTDSLIRDLEAGLRPEERLHAHFSSEYTFGRWEGLDGKAIFSSNPLQNGQTCVHKDPQGQMTLIQQDFGGKIQSQQLFPSAIVVRQWF